MLQFTAVNVFFEKPLLCNLHHSFHVMVGCSPGSVIALLSVEGKVPEGSKEDFINDATKVIMDDLDDGQLGTTIVDPDYLEVYPLGNVSHTQGDIQLKSLVGTYEVCMCVSCE